MKFEDVQQMTLEQSLTKVATYLRQGNKYDADLLLKVLDINAELLTCDLRDEKCNYKGAYSTIVVVKNTKDNTFYTAENCQFVYKRGVQGKMLPVGVVELVANTIVFLVEDFLPSYSTDSLVSTNYLTLYYPEFYVANTQDSVRLNSGYIYNESYYKEIEIGNFLNRKEIKVVGEGKSRYVIGLVVDDGSNKAYLYDSVPKMTSPPLMVSSFVTKKDK